jgi:S1-C subfamily serine protease
MIEVRSTFPGVVILPPGAGQGLRLGVGVVNHPSGGVRVSDVLPNSPGHRAGFEVGDVILEINGLPINGLQDYSNAIDDSSEKMEVQVSNVNDGQVLNVIVDLEN